MSPNIFLNLILKLTILCLNFFLIGTLFHCSHSKHSGKANHHMHQTPTNELIQMFESKERDEFQAPEKVIQFMGNLKGKKVIDIGAGSGYFTFRFSKKGAFVIAGDVNDEFLVHINSRKSKEDFSPGTITTRKLSYDSPKLSNAEVDIVFICNVYHHMENRIEYLTLLHKGLKKEGKIVIVDFPKNDKTIPFGGPPLEMRVSETEAKEELEKAGFKVKKVDSKLLPYQYILEAKMQ
jgi:predicted methyltransferase